jgi:ribosomal protein L29
VSLNPIPRLKGHGRRRAVDKVDALRRDLAKALTFLHEAGDEIALLCNDVTEARKAKLQAEEIVVQQLAHLEDLRAKHDEILAELLALKTRFGPELAAEANANAITVPPAVRDTSAIEDQATQPIPVVMPLHEAPFATTDPAHVPAWASRD